MKWLIIIILVLLGATMVNAITGVDKFSFSNPTYNDSQVYNANFILTNVSWNATPSVNVWWNNSYPYRKPISINTTDAISRNNLSVLINVSYVGGVKMNIDFSDIRFVNSSNSGTLNYWFYNNTFVSANSVWVWVKLDNNISATSNTTIYMYYGNLTTVVSDSNITKAFLFGDDFPGTAVNWNIWNSSNTSAYNVVNGNLLVNNSGTVLGVTKDIHLKNNVTTDGLGYAMEMRIQTNKTTASSMFNTPDDFWTAGDSADCYGGTFKDRVFMNTGAYGKGTCSLGLWYRLTWFTGTSGATMNVSGYTDAGAAIFTNQSTPKRYHAAPGWFGYNSAGLVDWVYVANLWDVSKPPTYDFGSEQVNNTFDSLANITTYLYYMNSTLINATAITTPLNSSNQYLNFTNISSGIYYFFSRLFSATYGLMNTTETRYVGINTNFTSGGGTTTPTTLDNTLRLYPININPIVKLNTMQNTTRPMVMLS